MVLTDIIFDGLPGLTHNYAGLSQGNVASQKSALKLSNPRQAARQSLDKMYALSQLGVSQGIFPPQMRPNLKLLRDIGYQGKDTEIWQKIWQDDPVIARMTCSASAMWAANAATVSTASETQDGRLHVTPANLISMPHRAWEVPQTHHMLQTLLADSTHFKVHAPLPAFPYFGDEGAANHTRLTSEHQKKAVDFFVYGQDMSGTGMRTGPRKYTARQARFAQYRIAENHGLHLDRCVFAQQAPDMIDAGVFHNDVIATGQGNFLFYYQGAFEEEERILSALSDKLEGELKVLCVTPEELSLSQVVETYLFNSQWLLKSGCQVGDSKSLIALMPQECREDPQVSAYIDQVLAHHPLIDQIITMDLRQSMRNGGGPACLRLRLPMTEAQQRAVSGKVWMTPLLYQQMCDWIDRHYRDHLSEDGLQDPALIDENYQALDQLTQILQLGTFYDFQIS